MPHLHKACQMFNWVVVNVIITRSVKIVMCLFKQDKMNNKIESIEFLPQFTLTTQNKILSD